MLSSTLVPLYHYFGRLYAVA